MNRAVCESVVFYSGASPPGPLEDVELAETMKTGLAVLLLALSALILLVIEILFHFSVLSHVETGIVGEITVVIDWGLFTTPAAYLVVSRFV